MAAASPLIDQADPSIFARMGIGDTSPKKPDAAPDTASPDVVKRVKAAVAKGGGADETSPPSQKPPAQGEMPKFPEMQPLPPPPKREDTPPIEAWGSLAMLAAALGGALSRNHATTALNAAGEAMKGIHQRDEEKYKDAMENWKIATENQQRMQTYEIETYKAIMTQNKTSFDEFMKLSRERQQEIATQLHAQTVAQGNERIANLLEHQQNEDAIKQMQALQKATGDMQKERDKIDNMNTATSEFTRLHAVDTNLTWGDFIWQYHPELAEKYKVPKPEAAASDSGGGGWFGGLFGGGKPATPPAEGGASYEPPYASPPGAPGIGLVPQAPAKQAPPSPSDYVVNGKNYHYKGTGDTRDIKNWEATPVQ